MPSTHNWIEELLPFPRPEYAKQTESLLTDLLWRSEGSSLATAIPGGYLAYLTQLQSASGFNNLVDPNRLVPQRRHGGSQRLLETFPIAKAIDTSALILFPNGAPSPVDALLESARAPRARGDKSDTCVPIHPGLVALQTLHGLVNKENPSNLAKAIETMAWLGGAPSRGHVAISYLGLFSNAPRDIKEGLTGFIDSICPKIGQEVWAQLPANVHANMTAWPQWPGVLPATAGNDISSAIAQHASTPFCWFWRKWQILCTAPWYESLPSRRFADWALCLLRTGLAFSYLWEAEFFSRLHACLLLRARGSTAGDAIQRIRSLLREGAILTSIEPFSIPASQKNIWTTLSELIAKGYEARRVIYEWDALDSSSEPVGDTLSEKLEGWLENLPQASLDSLPARLQVEAKTANNQKEFIKYLMLPRSSDDDLVDQADFYFLARTNASRNVWLHPGPEWLVVVASLLCQKPGGQCTLGQLLDDLSLLGIQIERSTLVAMLEQAGLSTDSPDADNAIVIRSGF